MEAAVDGSVPDLRAAAVTATAAAEHYAQLAVGPACELLSTLSKSLLHFKHRIEIPFECKRFLLKSHPTSRCCGCWRRCRTPRRRRRQVG
jgi:hypothetical protein